MEQATKRMICALSYFLVFSLIIISIFMNIPEEDSIKEVDCFDKEGNKILGLVCEEEIYGTSSKEKMFFISFLEIFAMFASIGSSAMIFPVEGII